jgi:hypothetical protein
MSGYQGTGRFLIERLSQAAEAKSIYPVALGCVVSAGLTALYLIWQSAFGHLRFAAEHPFTDPEMIGSRIALTVILLTGFTVGGAAYGRRANISDAEALGTLLRGSPQRHAALVDRLRHPIHSRAWIGIVVAALLSLLVVASKNPWMPYLFSNEPWNHEVVWALASNVLLFAILGGQVVGTFERNAIFAQMERELRHVDLLHPQWLTRFGRRGLRTAFFWIGGSSIASLVFVDQQFSWLIGLVIAGTVSLGTVAFFLPLRGLHRRICAEKEAELERVREAIHRDREALLSAVPEAAAAAMRMPGLLAYEHRIASVNEWPIDTPQVARFGLMLVIGVGSWLGGAVVGHVVDAVWH